MISASRKPASVSTMRLKNFFKILKFLLLLLPTLCTKPASVEAANEVRCIERERQALLKFKQGLIDDADVLSSWGGEEDKRECCKWQGITCSNRTDRVIVLDLSGQYMRGNYISPALLELRHLNYLDLSHNYFYGSRIPEFIGSVRKLRHLKLQSASFIGDVPSQLGNLTKLQTLDLNQGDTGLIIKNLEWLPRLSLLSYLDLSGISITETNWMSQIAKLPSLKDLHLKNCQLHKTKLAFDVHTNSSSLSSISVLDLSSNGLTSISTFSWLFNLSASLTSIDLSINQLDGPIPDEFGEITLLKSLDLSDNRLQGGIPKPFGNSSSLTNLVITKNNLSGLLPLLFQNLSGKAQTTLEILDLSSNHLSGALPDITQFSSLQSLTLENNQLNGILPQSLGWPSSLESLILEDNEIAGSLPDLRAFPSLTSLYIKHNRLENLHESFWQLSQLQELYAGSNLLNFTITEAHLSNLSSLSYLDLSYNYHVSFKLSSQWVPPFQLVVLSLRYCDLGPDFPLWIRTQNFLLGCDISSTGISDTVPNWFWDMSSIYYLNISHNQISGTIPDLTSNLSAVVDLSYNNFSGPIPLFLFRSQILQAINNRFSGSISHLCKISDDFRIGILDLSGNELTGELPDCLMDKSSVNILNLANNNFSGNVPRTIGALQQLQTLQLRNNNFTGELPLSLKNCTSLRIIDLGDNKMKGEIPAWIGDLTNLTVLSLRSNKFHGKLSPRICQLTNIQVLDVSRNNISGEIPPCFNKITSLVQKNSSLDGLYYSVGYETYVVDVFVYWKGQELEYSKLGLLKGIDLSTNSLIGSFPQEFSDLRGMVFLNLSRNQLTGNIISDIGQMERLEWLDLSRNWFSGHIPMGLAHLYSLSVLDLSYNNLTGEIPLGTQLQTFDPSVYSGNTLCGRPLPECRQDSPNLFPTGHGKRTSVQENEEFITRDFYMCSAFGFITGFWVVIVTLVLKHSWRLMYFNFLSNIGYWIYKTTIINVKRFIRKLQG